MLKRNRNVRERQPPLSVKAVKQAMTEPFHGSDVCERHNNLTICASARGMLVLNSAQRRNVQLLAETNARMFENHLTVPGVVAVVAIRRQVDRDPEWVVGAIAWF